MAGRLDDTTVFGKHCECIAQKCTHLERIQPLPSHLLLLSHCVLTQHGGQKKSRIHVSYSECRTRVGYDYSQRFGRLCYLDSRTQWVIL